MSNRNRRRARRIIEKAAVTQTVAEAAGGVTFTPKQVAALLDQSGSAGGQIARPLPRLTPQVPFGPGVPLNPAPLNAPRPDTGRPEPRRYEYPVAANLPGFGDRLVPWKVLRDAADRIGLFRRCIEIRKNEVATLDWGVVISPHAVERAQQAAPGAARSDVEREMRRRLEPEIARCVDFWEHPDRRNGYDFISWAKSLLEEHFVLDAVAIYPRMTRGGDLYSFECLDGSTVKPLLDEYGGRPLPPYPAYQQILYGFPRGEYVADVDTEGNIPGAYPADRLIYRVSNVRTWTPYGYSAVEQALDDGDLYLRRHGWLKAAYTDGVMPAGWLKAGEGQADWTVGQLAEYERAFNDYYAGSTQTRQRFRILPYGMTPDESSDVGEKYKPEYDLHLIKLVAAHFDTTLAELGFSEARGLGSTGWHQGQAEVQDRKATRPTLSWLQALVTDISRTFLGMPKELEFKILGLEAEDEKSQDEVGQARVQSGRSTLNEDRDRAGLPRYAFPEADKPFVVTAGGIQFVEGSSQAAAAQAVPAGGGVEPVAGSVDEQGAPAAGDETAPTAEPAPVDAEADVVKADEVRAYNRWRRKRTNPNRPFVFEHNTHADLDRLGLLDAELLDAVRFKADAEDGGGAGPKDQTPERAWPGWQVDLTLAALAAGALTSALTGAISGKTLAALWLAARSGAGVPQPDAGDGHTVTSAASADVLQWLHQQGMPPKVEAAVRGVLGDVYTQGYLVGDRSARSLLTGGPVEWGGWKPGRPDAARKLLSADGRAQGLELLLSQWDVHIKSISAHRLGDLAAVLADGLDAQQPPEEIARAVTGILDDPTWARMVTQTELSRAQTAAAHDRYQEAHVAATEWAHAPDDRVCPICLTNAAAGPVPLGEPFPSGDIGPPAHPWDRCIALPVVDVEEANTP